MGLWKSKVSNTASVFKGLMIYIYIYTHTKTHILACKMKWEPQVRLSYLVRQEKSTVNDTEWHMNKRE